MNSQTITQALARFASEIHSDEIPDSARWVARLSLLDWLSVGLAGGNEPVSVIVRRLVEAEGGVGRATVFGGRQRVPERAAALANGTVSHALDYDDTHFLYIGHPSVAVYPAVLAVAESRSQRIGQLIDAALLGMEAACRIGAWLGREHYQHGFHQTATSGCFGAVVAVAGLLQLDSWQVANALGLAASRAAGLKCQFGTMGKPYQAGVAASSGVEACQLAAMGFLSRQDALECEQGFAATHQGGADGSAVLLDGLGTDFLFETVQHKFHACCHGTHAALEALISIRDHHRLSPADIKTIVIRVHPRYLSVCNISEPSTGLEAKFSLRLTAAMVMEGRDTAAIQSFVDGECQRPQIVAMRDRVAVTTDPAVAETAAQVVVHTLSGKTLEAHHDLLAPISRGQREARVRTKAKALVGDALAEELWALVSSDQQPVASLAQKLSPAACDGGNAS